MLSRLETEIGFDKITCSFSIDDRSINGQKKGAFFSVTVSKQDGRAPGWTKDEAQVVSCILSKHVVLATFRDAQSRRIIGGDETKQELTAIFANYDRHLVSLMKKLDS